MLQGVAPALHGSRRRRRFSAAATSPIARYPVRQSPATRICESTQTAPSLRAQAASSANPCAAGRRGPAPTCLRRAASRPRAPTRDRHRTAFALDLHLQAHASLLEPAGDLLRSGLPEALSLGQRFPAEEGHVRAAHRHRRRGLAADEARPEHEHVTIRLGMLGNPRAVGRACAASSPSDDRAPRSLPGPGSERSRAQSSGRRRTSPCTVTLPPSGSIVLTRVPSCSCTSFSTNQRSGSISSSSASSSPRRNSLLSGGRRYGNTGSSPTITRLARPPCSR